MNDALSSSAAQNEPCVVHIIDSQTPLEFVLIRDATDKAKQCPTIILNVSNGCIVSGRANVPSNYSNERFNAKIWLKETFEAAGIEVSHGQNQVKNQCSVCNVMVSLQSEIIDAAKMARIQKAARLIVEKYCSGS